MTDAAAVPAYTVTARIFHWVTASLVLFMLPLGLVIANDWGGPLQDQLYDLHRSIGALIIPIILVRVVYRWGHPPLPLPDDIPAIQQLAANATHWALYALVILQPFRRLRPVRAAANLARGPCVLRSSALRSRPHRLDHRGPIGRTYRRRAPSSFRAQGPHPRAHDHGLSRECRARTKDRPVIPHETPTDI